MTKEEILKKSREENKNQDFAEKAVIAKSSTVAASIGFIMCGIITVISAITDYNNRLVAAVCWTIYFSMNGSLFLTKYFKLKKRHELMLSILFILLAVLFFTTFVLITTKVI